ncbi:retrovirus-related pol polyprotein from transposon TNT 1-94 [Tanacetum coccineum]
MTTLADKSLLSGGDNKPPMLEKHLYDSWKSRMELYMMNRPHGRMILASVEKGPLVWPSITEDGVTRLKEYVELTPAEAIQADCDIKAINIILQGLPTEIYALVSQHRVAKDLWEKINSLMQGNVINKTRTRVQAFITPYQTQQFTTNPSTPLSITYPSNEYQSTGHHNVYSPQPLIPQLEYAPTAINSNNLNFLTRLQSRVILPSSELKHQEGKDETLFNDKVLLCQAKQDGQALNRGRNSIFGRSRKLRVKAKACMNGITILENDTIDIPDSDETLMLLNILLESDFLVLSFRPHIILPLTVLVEVVKEEPLATAITEGTWGLKNLADVQKKSFINGTGLRTTSLGNLSVYKGGENVNECQKCLELKTELLNKKDFVDKETYDKLLIPTEVAFVQHTRTKNAFIRNLYGVEFIDGISRDNLYTLSLGNMMASSPICLLSKASKTKSWLWHRRLSHLNFDSINHLARHGLVRGLLKFEKDHLCSACSLGKSSKKPHKPKSEDTNQEKFYLLHMDLCGPMRVASVNGKKYILVIVRRLLYDYMGNN